MISLSTGLPFVKLTALYAVFSFFAFSLVAFVTHRPVFLETALRLKTQSGQGSFSMGVLENSWNQYVSAHSWIIPAWIITGFGVFLVIFIGIEILRAWLSPPLKEVSFFKRFCQENIIFLTCILLALAVYSLLFTALGHHPEGMKDGVINYLLYWMGQQGDPRIPGPSDYYIPRIIIYEVIGVLFSVIAFFVYLIKKLKGFNFAGFMLAFLGTVYLYIHVILLHSPQSSQTVLIWLICLCFAMAIVFGKKLIASFSFIPPETEKQAAPEEETANRLLPNGLRIFLIYWSVCSLLIYALLEEKVPWLLVHQVLPLLLLAGVFIGDVWAQLKPGAIRSVFAVFVGLFVLYEARANIFLNVYNNDNPREVIVYTQTDHSATDIVKEIERGAQILGLDYMPINPQKKPRKTIAFLWGEANLAVLVVPAALQNPPARGGDDRASTTEYSIFVSQYRI